MLAALILVGGSLGDRLGRRRTFSAGVLLFALASVWCGLAPNITQLIVARGVQGVGAALLVPGSLALISANFGKQRRGQAIGTWSGFTSIAAGIGPVLGGWLVERFSWRWMFFINLPLAAAVLVIARWRVPESRDEQAKGRVDWVGGTLATVGVGGIVFGLIESSARGLTAPLGLFRSKTFAGANLLTLLLYAALGGLLFFLPFNLIQVSALALGGRPGRALWLTAAARRRPPDRRCRVRAIRLAGRGGGQLLDEFLPGGDAEHFQQQSRRAPARAAGVG